MDVVSDVLVTHSSLGYVRFGVLFSGSSCVDEVFAVLQSQSSQVYVVLMFCRVDGVRWMKFLMFW